MKHKRVTKMLEFARDLEDASMEHLCSNMTEQAFAEKCRSIARSIELWSITQKEQDEIDAHAERSEEHDHDESCVGCSQVKEGD